MAEMIAHVKAHATRYHDWGWGWDLIGTLTQTDFERLLANRRSLQGAVDAVHTHLRPYSEKGKADIAKRRAEGRPEMPVRYRSPR